MAMSKGVGLFLKLTVLGGLTVVILVSLAFVGNVIGDRANYRNEATQSISQSYAQEQQLLGPVLVQPYRQTMKVEKTDDKGVKSWSTEVADSSYTIFPARLNVAGELKPSVRRHGLYKVPVYEFNGSMSGHFDVPASALKGDAEYGIAYLALRVSDARGIVDTPVMTVNGRRYPVVGGTLTQAELDSPEHTGVQWKSNLRTLLPLESGVKPGAGVASGLDFKLDLTLAGTQEFDLVPVGNANHFELRSNWSGPLFAGQFLPRTREVGAQGFSAVWDVSSLASATQQQLTTDANGKVDAVSVSLADLIDPYSLAQRAVKYGVLFVLLTFGGFFLFELGKRMQIHPVQYLLVGVCQAVFFLLLVSFSERMGFGAAYGWASVACIGILTYYLVFVLKSAVYGLSFGGILSVLYAAIYGLLVSEDNALLMGSLLLFGVIALVMILTRKVDWYVQTEALVKSEDAG